ncbi:MAG: hypothetical protein LBQ21_03215 [Clostridiales Family XIII bacterium]|jgi:X-X-X-Leu-X-X-Gly heptad repeat protein|nr:hypothetical protein [Clostridiales Family XIII bacterium]
MKQKHTKQLRRRVAISLLIAVLTITVLSGSTEAARVIAAENIPGQTAPENAGIVSAKEEVIYANLTATGAVKEAYAVNILNVSEAGIVADHGQYTELKNLTSTETLNQDGERITVKAPVGSFYYQGTLTSPELPWNIRISYTLDGKEMTPAELAEQSGHLVIKLTTVPNPEADPAFFENYLLQASISLDSSLCTNITSDGTIANAGKNKLVTSTVMPGKEGSLTLNADVKDFSMNGIELSALPPAFHIDAPDSAAFEGELSTLTDAISSLNSGAKKLKDGAATLREGAATLKSGSADYAAGLNALNANATTLVEGSAQIGTALEQLSGALANISPQLAAEVAALNAGHANFQEGLVAYTDGVSAMADAYKSIDTGIAGLSDGAGGLHTGLDSLYSGTAKLSDAAKELPDRVKTEIDKLAGGYDKSDFVPPSFTDPKNGQVSAVQFIIKTERIEREKVQAKTNAPEQTGFWERFLDLFR